MEKIVLYQNGKTSVNSVKGAFNGLFSIESQDSNKAEELFEDIFSVIPLKDGEKEPMVNILCWFQNNSYTILMYVRDKHRPSHYYKENEDNILLSPASVDLGGVLITPLEKDFYKMNSGLIKEILDEICISKEENMQIIEKIKTIL